MKVRRELPGLGRERPDGWAQMSKVERRYFVEWCAAMEELARAGFFGPMVMMHGGENLPRLRYHEEDMPGLMSAVAANAAAAAAAWARLTALREKRERRGAA